MQYAVGEALDLQLADTDETDQRVLGAAERICERLLCSGRRVVALGHVVLKEPDGAVGPRLARAERAVVRVFGRPAIGLLVDRAGSEQLIQPPNLGRILLSRGPGALGDRAALVHQPLPGLERLLLVVQGSRQLLHLPQAAPPPAAAAPPPRRTADDTAGIKDRAERLQRIQQELEGTFFSITHEGSDRIIAEHEHRVAEIEALRAKDRSNAEQVDRLIGQSAAVREAQLSQLRAKEVEAAEKVRAANECSGQQL